MSEPFEPAGQTRATARLPGLEIEIVHRVSRGCDAEQLSINLQAVPSFEAFGRWLEAANPFAFWMNATQIFWSSWLAWGNSLLAPGAAPLSRPSRDMRPHRVEAEER